MEDQFGIPLRENVELDSSNEEDRIEKDIAYNKLHDHNESEKEEERSVLGKKFLAKKPPAKKPDAKKPEKKKSISGPKNIIKKNKKQ